jgi:hypothetical protein
MEKNDGEPLKKWAFVTSKQLSLKKQKNNKAFKNRKNNEYYLLLETSTGYGSGKNRP